MSREVPLDHNAICDGCGKRGAFDVMGDLYCADCLDDGPCPDGQHVWTGQQQGGSPDTAEAAEWVGYCDVCGMEGPED